MATRLILQGLTDGNHLDEVCEVLSLDQAQLVIVSVAFVRSSGVAPLSDALQKVSKKGCRSISCSEQRMNHSLSVMP